MKGDKIIFEAKFDGQWLMIPEVRQSAKAIYEFWYQAMVHINLKPQPYDTQLPGTPENFDCDSFTKSKLTQSPCPPTIPKGPKKFDRIHSDLSGIFPVPVTGQLGVTLIGIVVK
jgi:hypothetical protein